MQRRQEIYLVLILNDNVLPWTMEEGCRVNFLNEVEEKTAEICECLFLSYRDLSARGTCNPVRLEENEIIRKPAVVTGNILFCMKRITFGS